MNIGVKIRKLREIHNWSQFELANRLGIAQTTLCNIESGIVKKIDFLLINKVRIEFDVDFNYFIDDNQANKVGKMGGGTTANNLETLVDQIKLLIAENKQKEERIKEMEMKLNKNFHQD